MAALRKGEANWIESCKRWQLTVQNDGERKTFTSTQAGKKGKIQAEQKADKWLESGLKVTAKRFDETYEAFIKEVETLIGITYYKQLEYIGRLYLSPVLGHKKLQTITEQNWQDCIT